MGDPGDQCQVARFESPQTWRLIKKVSGVEGKGLEESEELVFTLVGVICAHDLPPIKEKPSVVARQYKYLRQSISITGIGSPTFGAAVEATHLIFDMFQRQFQEGALAVWETPSHQSYPTLPMSNRYLTPRRDAPHMEHIPFEAEVDPHGYLESMIKDGYIHGEENNVEYYTQSTKEGKKIFVESGPQTFRVGDIVEVQVSFVVVPLKQQRYKMMGVLHAIALLDTSFSQVQEATRKRSRTASAPRTAIVSLKRKVGYQTEGQRKKANMEVDE
ncbi:hypothetical protein BD779DRAFT_1455315 [Infundibulicybe gibba]|nr:hypothetical protein BD779DRAFT_1455315 [Infundibulicybe gibba]